MEKNMNVKQEIMENELDKVAGGKVNVTKVMDTVTKVVDTVKKVMPNKTSDGGDKKEAAPVNGDGAGGVFKQTFQKNTKLNNQLSVNGDNNAGNLKF